MEGPTTGDNHTRAAEVQTGTQLTHSTSVAVPLIVTTVVAAEVVLVGVEVQAVVVRVILVLVPKVVVLGARLGAGNIRFLIKPVVRKRGLSLY